MAKTPNQILEVVERSAFGLPAEYEIDRLRLDYEKLPKSIGSFADFVPIRLATFLETTTRQVISTVVDHGEPFSTNGAVFLSRESGRNISVDVLRSISANRLTLGHLVSHAVSTNRLSEIMSALQSIFGGDIRADLAAASERWTEDEGQDEPRIIPDIEATLAALDHLLKVRHILVHERPQSPPYDAADLMFYLEHCRNFIGGLGWHLIARTHGRVPRTQLSMKQFANGEYATAKAELEALVGEVPDELQDCLTLHEKVEYFWEKFSKHAAELRAGYGREDQPGSIAPMLRASEMTRLTRWRVNDVTIQNSRKEGEL